MSGRRPTPPKRVMLLDGDLRTSERLASLLREDGCEVEVLCDGASALARLSQEALPDVLVTELAVPLADGATVARFALSRCPAMQIVVLTRYPNRSIPPAFGVKPPIVLAKPLDYACLLEVLSDATNPSLHATLLS